MLVIDSISLDERTWINPNGWFHSDQAHVIERLRRPSRNYLDIPSTPSRTPRCSPGRGRPAGTPTRSGLKI